MKHIFRPQFLNPNNPLCVCIGKGGVGGQQSKHTALECMFRNFRKDFKDDYSIKLTPEKLSIL